MATVLTLAAVVLTVVAMFNGAGVDEGDGAKPVAVQTPIRN